MADKNSELSELKKYGAKPQKNSGRGKHDKGDGTIDGLFMVDIKEYAQSYSLSIDGWAKICTDAFKAGGLEPLIGVTLGTGNKKVRLAVISKEMFDIMKAAYLREQGI